MFFEQVVLWRYPRHEKEIQVIERSRSVVFREAPGKIAPHFVAAGSEAKSGEAIHLLRVAHQGSVIYGLLLSWVREVGIPLDFPGFGKRPTPGVSGLL